WCAAVSHASRRWKTRSSFCLQSRAPTRYRFNHEGHEGTQRRAVSYSIVELAGWEQDRFSLFEKKLNNHEQSDKIPSWSFVPFVVIGLPRFARDVLAIRLFQQLDNMLHRQL